ncbi:NAD(P)/FAD-dependent oxidoreductase [Dasania sp. GY-MA-18]|uniref:NAD(P)/FAD-dependent oxidoreductase n=1 Tax=Dasania phycosphaerae TaxID=2950436 RepID=A0A9J6RJ12_9GAMM|nr:MULTISPECIES: NAD(P)/FAD-dependent oxidoreductase [Dasania]MCR8921812.1 NAD(P)/FAD-dependent oxidoreductase [Dasania sp. GY-MA-18]MCZ0864240.1 NAD(P)/FAD-dependent oxidoreductase [Dasania phycosphaerae]MCZ0867968.1 NAD(P)/FAD-dependent oxidoreductase [Dasania phycosphaerae]
MSLVNHYDAIIIGGGASGLFCAGLAGQRGLRVLVLDSSNKVGKKILMSGGGRCNFTNLYVTPDNYLCQNPHFPKSALSSYNQWQFIELVERYQIPYHERKHGELFCDDSAKDILNMLLAECELGQVAIKTRCTINTVSHQSEQGFNLVTSLGSFSAKSLVVASGGLSIPTMGATGFGYELAQQFGHSLLPRTAGLVPFTFSDHIKGISERLSGLAVDVELSTANTSFRENVLFTHRGLSGPVVLQLSNYWQPGALITMNLLPDSDIAALLLNYKSQHAKSLLRNLLSQHLAKALVAELQTLFWPQYADTAMAEIPDAVLKTVAENLSAWQLKPSGTEGYRTAEVTLGGVNTDELSSKTMASKNQPGLFFIGEVVDVTGHLGGFNFQWAWASAYAAAQYL